MGGKKKGAGAGASPPAAASAAAEVTKPTSWAESLALDPAKAEAEKKRLEANKKKAEASQRDALQANYKREQWLQQAQKEDRKKRNEENQWSKQVEKDRKLAFSQGVLESWEYEDGTYWVCLSEKESIWKECQGQYFCPLCDKHLNDATLGAHCTSQAHTKKLEWQTGASPAAPAAPAAPKAPAAPSSSSSSRAAASASAASWGAAAQGGAASASLEAWQQRRPDGLVTCIPCGKVVDELHLATKDHIQRLEAFLFQKESEKSGYPTPVEPYLAYVPCDESDPSSERWLKCLLCSKWCQDETSHTGSRERPEGSKDHQKNLRNYFFPGDAWYQANVAAIRAKYHGPTQASPSKAASRAAPPGAAPPTSAPWAKAGGAAAAAAGPTPAKAATTAPWAKAAASAPSPAPPPAPPPAADALPAGWFSAKDPEGKTYYYKEDGTVQWDPPAEV